MIDEREIIERAVRALESDEPGLERMLRRRDRKRRNQRLRAGVIAVVIAIVGVGLFLRAERSDESVPADRPITVDNVGDLQVTWTASAPGGGEFANIRAADGMVFVTAFEKRHGTLLAFPQDCATTCAPIWRASIGCCESMPDGPLVMDGMVFVTEGDTLYAFDEHCATGGAPCQPLWRGVVLDAAQYQPVGADGIVYTGSTGGTLYAWDEVCGSGDSACAPIWASASQHNPLQPSGVADGLVYVGPLDSDSASHLNAVYAFPAVCTDGCRPTAKALLPVDLASRPAVLGGTVVVGTASLDTGSGTAVAYPRSCAFEPGCTPQWQGTMPGAGNMPDPIVADGVVFFTSTVDGFVRAFPSSCTDPCSPLWTAIMFDPSLNEPVAADGLFYLPSTTLGLLIYPVACATHDGVCDSIWTSLDTVSATVSGVAVDGGRVFIRTTDGRLIALAPMTAPSGK